MANKVELMTYSAKIDLDDSGFNKGLSNADKGFSKLSGTFKATSLAMAALVGSAGLATVKLGKKVLSEFADYEQLVGGVDTLFKESSKKLQEYAANAYKTAGLSGNEYMETVTSFSASLIQSLGGDTEKAVKYAHTAITDMSDNANKMGTDMGSIQNAYQGFAKQNYTMLDNLKLGYGGTKSEMERLLADATAISGISYDVSSYADVVDAIHIIQDSLGITGTTALEAEDTISGSLNSMKSAWKNMLAGLGDVDSDMGKLTENLVEAFGNVVKNVVPIIQNITSALPDAIKAILPIVGELLPDLINTATTLFQEVLSALLELLPELIPVAVSAVITIVDTIVENLPLIINGALELITALAQGLIEYLPKLIPTVVKIILEMVNTLLDNLPMLIDCAIDLILALVDGILEALPMMLEQGPIIIKKLIDGIVGAIPKLVDAAIEIIMGIVEYMINNLDTMIKASLEIILAIAGGLIKAIPELLKAIPKLFIALVKGFMEMDWLQIGKDILSGIGKGLIDGVKNIGGAIKDAAGSVVSGFKDFFGIKSPSRLFRDQVGKFLADGLGLGFTQEMKKITKDMQKAVPTNFETTGLLRVKTQPIAGASILTNSSRASTKIADANSILGHAGSGSINISQGDIIINGSADDKTISNIRTELDKNTKRLTEIFKALTGLNKYAVQSLYCN